eukprot:2854906-Lingulodinium_polyedra.AAC.1
MAATLTPGHWKRSSYPPSRLEDGAPTFPSAAFPRTSLTPSAQRRVAVDGSPTPAYSADPADAR